MDGLFLIGVVLVCLCIVLPIVALVRTSKISRLELRLAGVEAALLRLMRQQQSADEGSPAGVAPEMSPESTAPPVVPVPVVPAPTAPPALAEAAHQPEPAPSPAFTLLSTGQEAAGRVEIVIGQKWLGWVAVVLIFCAAAFFLKYAFENRWIGELGRVAFGIATGLAFAWAGLERYRKGWPYLSQILTAGGITILYLSVYSAFGYYHLVNQATAFVFLLILVAEATLLALVYNARSIAVMALAGGFLTPVLLSTGRDQYAVLFTYIVVLDLGMLTAVIARRWRWIGSLAYAATQFLFWAWYTEHYHQEKRIAVLIFQSAVFVLFMLADLAPHLRRHESGREEWIRLAVNPFAFYATCYLLLNEDHHGWMAALALVMAGVYAALARAELVLRPSDRRMLLITIGTALTFVTLAVPVQLESNWITIAWGVEAVVLLWASFEASAPLLRLLSALVFVMALLRFVFADTPWGARPPFTPVFNRYFFGMLALAACLSLASSLYRRMGPSGSTGGANTWLMAAMLAAGVFWLGSSFEVVSYFDARAQAVLRSGAPSRAPSSAASGVTTGPRGFEAQAQTDFQAASQTANQLRWAGQLSLSILWSVYAGLMTAAGFRLELYAWRVAGLVLFGLTLVKVVFLDISELREFYRIMALLGLGVVLLVVAWKYQRVLRREQPR